MLSPQHAFQYNQGTFILSDCLLTSFCIGAANIPLSFTNMF